MLLPPADHRVFIGDIDIIFRENFYKEKLLYFGTLQNQQAVSLVPAEQGISEFS